MKLVENWRKAWTWISMHAMTISLAISGSWLAVPEDMRAALDPKLVAAITIPLMVVGIIGRLIKQEGKE